MNNRIRQILVLAVLVFVLSFSTNALAKDVARKLGVGVDSTLNAATLGIGEISSSSASTNAPGFGLSIKYWINNDWAIQGVFGFMYAASDAVANNYEDNTNDPSDFWAFSFDIKGIYNFAKGDMANLGAFLTFHMQKENTTLRRPAGPYDSNLGFSFAIGLTPEIFITENFALNAEFGITVRVQQGFAAGFSGDNVLGGFGFHYYF